MAAEGGEKGPEEAECSSQDVYHRWSKLVLDRSSRRPVGSVFVDLFEHGAHATSAKQAVALFLDVDLSVAVELGEHLLQEGFCVLLERFRLGLGLQGRRLLERALVSGREFGRCGRDVGRCGRDVGRCGLDGGRCGLIVCGEGALGSGRSRALRELRWELQGRAGTMVLHSAAAVSDPPAAVVRRLLTQTAPPSPELSPRTGKQWSFLTFDAPLEPLRALARQGGGTLDDAAVAHARRLVATMERTLWQESGGFQDHPAGGEPLGALRYRDRPFEENALAARMLLRLSRLTGDRGCRAMAERILAVLSPLAGRYAVEGATFAMAVEEFFELRGG